METLDEVIEALANGKSHTVYELARKADTSLSKMGKVIKFLSTYDFVTRCSGYAVRVKLNPKMWQFWRRIKELE